MPSRTSAVQEAGLAQPGEPGHLVASVFGWNPASAALLGTPGPYTP